MLKANGILAILLWYVSLDQLYEESNYDQFNAALSTLHCNPLIYFAYLI